jgi:hypothetical protein
MASFKLITSSQFEPKAKNNDVSLEWQYSGKTLHVPC